MDLTFLKRFTENYLPLVPNNSPPVTRGLLFMITVPSETIGSQLASELKRAGYTQLRLEKIRIFIAKKWRLSGLSCPVKYTPSDIHAWLDRIDASARSHGAELETWTPSE
jgi:hypothetical protein